MLPEFSTISIYIYIGHNWCYAVILIYQVVWVIGSYELENFVFSMCLSIYLSVIISLAKVLECLDLVVGGDRGLTLGNSEA